VGSIPTTSTKFFALRKTRAIERLKIEKSKKLRSIFHSLLFNVAFNGKRRLPTVALAKAGALIDDSYGWQANLRTLENN
jgi:hypothetical protein